MFQLQDKAWKLRVGELKVRVAQILLLLLLLYKVLANFSHANIQVEGFTVQGIPPREMSREMNSYRLVYKITLNGEVNTISTAYDNRNSSKLTP